MNFSFLGGAKPGRRSTILSIAHLYQVAMVCLPRSGDCGPTAATRSGPRPVAGASGFQGAGRSRPSHDLLSRTLVASASLTAACEIPNCRAMVDGARRTAPTGFTACRSCQFDTAVVFQFEFSLGVASPVIENGEATSGSASAHLNASPPFVSVVDPTHSAVDGVIVRRAKEIREDGGFLLIAWAIDHDDGSRASKLTGERM